MKPRTVVTMIAVVIAAVAVLQCSSRDSNNRNNNSKNKQAPEPRRIITKKIGRNEPCPCGSGKKYKQCHGN